MKPDYYQIIKVYHLKNQFKCSNVFDRENNFLSFLNLVEDD